MSRKGDTEKIFSCSLHPREPLMAFGCETNVVKLYDIQKYAYVRILPMHGVVYAVRFSQCGTFLATASSSPEHDLYRILIWKVSLADGQWKLEKIADDNMTYESLQEETEIDKKAAQIREFFVHQGRINTLEFIPPRVLPLSSKDGNPYDKCMMLASGSNDQTVRIWTFGKLEEVSNEGLQKTEVWRKHTGSVTCIRATMDGAFLASCADEDYSVCIWKLRKTMPSEEEDAKGGVSIAEKLFEQVVEFRTQSPLYSLSFFPIVQQWKNSQTKRYILACGSEQKFFLLKITNMFFAKPQYAVSYTKEVMNLTSGESAWKTIDKLQIEEKIAILKARKKPDAVKKLLKERFTFKDSKGEPNSIEVALDYSEEIQAQSAEEGFKALTALDTAVHIAEFEPDGGKGKIKYEKFLLAIGGGTSGKINAWVFSKTPEEFRSVIKSEFVPYPSLKRILVEKRREAYLAKKANMAKDKSKRKSDDQKDKEDNKLQKFKNKLKRLRNGYVPVGEHMQGSTIMGIALPQLLPDDTTIAAKANEPAVDAKTAIVVGKGKGVPKLEELSPIKIREGLAPYLLNKLRDIHKMLTPMEYVAVTVSDDETARVFKFSVKEPHQVSIKDGELFEEEEKRENALEKAAANIKKGITLFKNFVTQSEEKKKKAVPVVFCVASGERSKTTKKMDDGLVLQRSLTENQANLLYSLNEQARDMRKRKVRNDDSRAMCDEETLGPRRTGCESSGVQVQARWYLMKWLIVIFITVHLQGIWNRISMTMI